MLSCGVGVSRARSGAQAAEEAVHAALRDARGEADVILLHATETYGDPRPIVAAARAAARAVGDRIRVVGCASSGVLSAAGEVEDGAGVAATALGGTSLTPFLAGDASEIPRAPGERGLALAFLDGQSAHPDTSSAAIAAALPGFAVAGLVASGAEGALPARWLDDELSGHGMSGLLLSTDVEPIVAVTQACRPIGPVHTVTRARGKVIETLDGRPAFLAFAEPARPLLGDLQRAAQTILVVLPGEAGAAGDPDEAEIETGYVVRGILQFDPDRGFLALSDPVPEGSRLRFAVRDVHAAHHDLRRVLGQVAKQLDGRTPRIGFYYASAGRGRVLHGRGGHDVAMIQGALGPFPLAGATGGAEIGPAPRAPRMHLFSGVLAVIP